MLQRWADYVDCIVNESKMVAVNFGGGTAWHISIQASRMPTILYAGIGGYSRAEKVAFSTIGDTVSISYAREETR